MENKELKEEIKRQARIIKRLKFKIKKLENDLYYENNKRPLNQKTFLRAKDIVELYPIGKSTLWLYVKQKKIKAIKKSEKVTIFDAKEIEDFFAHKAQTLTTLPPQLKRLLKKR